MALCIMPSDAAKCSLNPYGSGKRERARALHFIYFTTNIVLLEFNGDAHCYSNSIFSSCFGLWTDIQRFSDRLGNNHLLSDGLLNGNNGSKFCRRRAVIHDLDQL